MSHRRYQHTVAQHTVFIWCPADPHDETVTGGARADENVTLTVSTGSQKVIERSDGRRPESDLGLGAERSDIGT